MTDKSTGLILGMILGVFVGIAATLAFYAISHNIGEKSAQPLVAAETQQTNTKMPFGAIEITLTRGNCSGIGNGPEYTVHMNSYGDAVLDCRWGGRTLKPINYNVGHLRVYYLAALLYYSGYFELNIKHEALVSHGSCITTRVQIGDRVNQVYDLEAGIEKLDAMEYLIEVVGETERHLPEGFPVRPSVGKGGS